MQQRDWMVSLHGGHSGEFCDHAQGTLREVLEVAVAAGFSAFGVSEHAPRAEARWLYPEELAMGWDLAKIHADFERYAAVSEELVEEFADRLVMLRGFETEAVPSDGYVELMRGHRKRHGFDYMVGSVHHVHEFAIDGHKEALDSALVAAGGIEALAEAYYAAVTDMVKALQPEVVAHLDLVRKNVARDEDVETPAIRLTALTALDAIAEAGSILDINTAGYRKGIGRPYVSPWLLQEASKREIGVCFGDDSHGPHHVGKGIEEARVYLLKNGYRHITALTKEKGLLVRKRVAL